MDLKPVTIEYLERDFPTTGKSKNWKQTKARKYVYNLLHFQNRPMTATRIFHFIKEYQPNISLSTIYRSIDFFLQKDLIRSMDSLDHKEVLYEIAHEEHRHYAICLTCREYFPFHDCPVRPLMPELRSMGFHYSGHKLEIYGYCNDCLHLKE